MKIVTHTEMVLEPGDLALIEKGLPKDPCIKCSALADHSCCGCPKGDEYAKKVKLYKDRNIFELAQKHDRYYAVIDEIDKLEDEQFNLAAELINAGVFDSDDFK